MTPEHQHMVTATGRPQLAGTSRPGGFDDYQDRPDIHYCMHHTNMPVVGLMQQQVRTTSPCFRPPTPAAGCPRL